MLDFIYLTGLLTLSTPSFAEPETSEEPDSDAQQAAPIMDPHFLVREAVRRIDVADFEGAQVQLKMALYAIFEEEVAASNISSWLSGDFSTLGVVSENVQRGVIDILYLLAGTLHESHDFLEALTLYRAITAHFEANHRSLDIQFRTATVLSKMKRHKEASVVLNKMGPKSNLAQLDRRKIKLMKRAFKFRETSKLKYAFRLDRSLKKFSSEQIHYERARLSVDLIRFFHEEMNQYSFDGSQRSIIRSHQKCQNLHQLCVQQLERTIQVKQPQWVAQALVLISENLMNIGDMLLLSPLPPELMASQEVEYRLQMRQYVNTTWIKSLRYVNEGLHLASRMGLSPSLQKKMASIKEAITQRIESEH